MARLMRTASELIDMDDQHALDMDIVRRELAYYFPMGDDKDYVVRNIEDYNWLDDLLASMRTLGVDVTMFDNVDHIFYFNGRDDFNKAFQTIIKEWLIDPYDFFSQMTSSTVNVNHHWILVTADDKVVTHGDDLDKLFEEAYSKAVDEISAAAQNGYEAFTVYDNNMPFSIDEAVVQK